LIDTIALFVPINEVSAIERILVEQGFDLREVHQDWFPDNWKKEEYLQPEAVLGTVEIPVEQINAYTLMELSEAINGEHYTPTTRFYMAKRMVELMKNRL
jgi:hypothetical protein